MGTSPTYTYILIYFIIKYSTYYWLETGYWELCIAYLLTLFLTLYYNHDHK